jgi:hypothetical protein
MVFAKLPYYEIEFQFPTGLSLIQPSEYNADLIPYQKFQFPIGLSFIQQHRGHLRVEQAPAVSIP